MTNKKQDIIIHSQWDKSIQYLTSQHREFKSFSNFREWDSITSIPLYEVHPYHAYIEYAKDIQSSLTGKDRDQWEKAMGHSIRGYRGVSDLFYKHSVPLDSLTTNPHSLKANHHFFKYNSLTRNSILDFDRIVELGGGCGDFAKFIINMGFKGEYAIIDIPEVLEVQKYNLLGYEVDFTSRPVSFKPNTLFVSTWGLSECPIPWRLEVLNALSSTNWLITYQSRYHEMSNEDYFKGFSGVREDIPWIPWDGGSKYLLR